jgi:hypothetical protein
MESVFHKDQYKHLFQEQDHQIKFLDKNSCKQFKITHFDRIRNKIQKRVKNN